MHSQSAEIYWYIIDALSTVRLVVDGSGAVVASYASDEFGNQTAATGSADLRQHTYTGGLGVRDDGAALGLLYARQRYYDASLGRWLSADPIGFAGGLNLHTYVGNDPIGSVDPEGLVPPPRPFPIPASTTATRGTVGQFVRGVLVRAAPALADGPLPIGDALAIASVGKFIWDSATKTNNQGTPAPMPQPVMQRPRPTPTTTETPEDDFDLYRFGNTWEATNRLKDQCEQANAKEGFGYGVSTNRVPRPNKPNSHSTARRLREAGFGVRKTGTDPGHFTVIFQAPVTPEQARRFNEAFGRRR